MINPFLIGEKIYLRPLCLEDTKGNYSSWLNDPETNKQNSHHVYPYSSASLEEYVNNAYTDKSILPLAIADIENDNHIGNISLVDIDYINRKTSYGIIIGEREYFNKGIAKESSFLLFKHAFDSLNLERIYSGTTSENIGGQKLMEALGMIKEGVRRSHLYKNGRYYDMIEYGVLKREFCHKFNLNFD